MGQTLIGEIMKGGHHCTPQHPAVSYPLPGKVVKKQMIKARDNCRVRFTPRRSGRSFEVKREAEVDW